MTEVTIDSIESPISGTVVELLVSNGSAVNAGDEVAVLESMKMEIPVESPMAGTVAEVLVEVGQRVAEGDRLLVMR